MRHFLPTTLADKSVRWRLARIDDRVKRLERGVDHVETAMTYSKAVAKTIE